MLLSVLLLSTLSLAGAGFVWATCKPGYEKLLKAEVLLGSPQLKFAFSRPGLLTFKQPEETSADFDPSHSIFVRSWGESVLGQAGSAGDILEAASILRKDEKQPLRLHVFGRQAEEGLKAEHPLVSDGRSQRVEALKAELISQQPPGLFATDVQQGAQEAERVLDVVVGEDNEKTFVGTHIHSSHSRRSSFPNAQLPSDLPADAPSRAWLKAEHAAQALKVPFAAGDVAVEIGSAPGGSALNLVRRGLIVFGVDPCPQDRTHAPVLLNENSRFTEVKSKLHTFSPTAQGPPTATWLLCDANIDAEDALPHLLRLCRHYQSTGLRGLLYTLKLYDSIINLPPDRLLTYLDSIKAEMLASGLFDADSLVFTTLPSNRQEVCVYAPVTRTSTSNSKNSSRTL